MSQAQRSSFKTLELSEAESQFKHIAPLEKLIRLEFSLLWLVYWFIVPVFLMCVVFLTLHFGASIFGAQSSWSRELMSYRDVNRLGLTLFQRMIGASEMLTLGIIYRCLLVRSIGLLNRLSAALSLLVVAYFFLTFCEDIDFELRIPSFGVESNLLLFMIYAMEFLFWWGQLRGLIGVFRVPLTIKYFVSPLTRLKLFPRSNVRRISAIPSTVQFVRGRRFFLILLFVVASSFFTVVPYNAQKALDDYHKMVLEIFHSCESGNQNPKQCILDNIREESLATLIAIPLAILLSLWGGNKILAFARRRTVIGLHDAQESDARSPILFLRSFRDDQVKLARPILSLFGAALEFGQPASTLDTLLLEEAADYGPLVGLGNPTDATAPFGAARGYYFEGMAWRDAFTELASKAKAIVVCIDDTADDRAGIWWEIDHLYNSRLLDKTLFVFHPKMRALSANADLFGKIVARLHFEAEEIQNMNKDINSAAGLKKPIVGFFNNSDNEFYWGASKYFSRITYQLLLRSFLRIKFGEVIP